MQNQILNSRYIRVSNNSNFFLYRVELYYNYIFSPKCNNNFKIVNIFWTILITTKNINIGKIFELWFLFALKCSIFVPTVYLKVFLWWGVHIRKFSVYTASQATFPLRPINNYHNHSAVLICISKCLLRFHLYLYCISRIMAWPSYQGWKWLFRTTDILGQYKSLEERPTDIKKNITV